MKSLLKTLSLVVCFFMMASLSALANNNKNYYSKVTAKATGNGKVYVSYKDEATAPEYAESHSAESGADEQSSAPTHTYYLYAQANEGYKFGGWYDKEDCSGSSLSTDTKYHVSVTGEAEESKATKNYFAKFVEATLSFNSTMTAYCVGEGGSVAVSTEEGNTDFGIEKTSSTLNSDFDGHTYYLQAKPVDAELYRFLGWYSDEACENQLSKNANYTYNVVAESTDETAPSAFRAYAKFEKIPYYYSVVRAAALGEGRVNVAASDTDGEYAANSEYLQKVADKAEHTYYLKAQAEGDETDFDGWFSDAECTNKLSDATAYTYKVTSTSQEEASATTFNVYAKFTTRDMYQVRNAGFEKWAADNEPGFGWNSFPSATGGQAALGKGLSPNPSKVEGRNGGSAVRLNSKFVGLGTIGANANGNLTTGTVNMGSMTPSNASNHNYTDTKTKGHYLVIAGQPDVVEFYSKYKKGQTGDYCGHAQFIIHDEYNYRDPEVNEELEHKIGSCGVDINESEGWVRNTGDFSYIWEKDAAAATTKYLLINFTTNVVPGGSKDDELILDDIRLIYNSELATAEYDGDELTFTDGAATCDALYDESNLTLTSNGRAATIVTSYDDATAVLTITVNGENISSEADNYHTYTIQFKAPASANMSISAAAGYATFVAPFVVTIPEGVTAYTVSTVSNDGMLTLTEVSDEIPANTPVVLESATDINSTVTGVAVEGTPVAGLLTGVYADTTAPAGSYVLQNQEGKVGFYLVEDVQPVIKANRCYLTTAAGSQSRALYFGEDIVSALNAAVVAGEGKNLIYDLQGRRVAGAGQKGMFIVNGKKVIR